MHFEPPYWIDLSFHRRLSNDSRNWVPVKQSGRNSQLWIRFTNQSEVYYSSLRANSFGKWTELIDSDLLPVGFNVSVGSSRRRFSALRSTFPTNKPFYDQVDDTDWDSRLIKSCRLIKYQSRLYNWILSNITRPAQYWISFNAVSVSPTHQRPVEWKPTQDQTILVLFVWFRLRFLSCFPFFASLFPLWWHSVVTWLDLIG